MTQVQNPFDPIIIELPEGFPIKTNPGLHGDMQFFEVGDLRFTICAPVYGDDTVSFAYVSWDSDEGTVTIEYQTYSGETPLQHEQGDNDSWDVRVSADSDVWGLERTGEAVAAAIKLHKALGRDKPYRE